MSKRTDTEKLVAVAFEQEYGSVPLKITDQFGRIPSENNSYLYNLVLNQFEGSVIDRDRNHYFFTITQNADSGNWEYVFQSST